MGKKRGPRLHDLKHIKQELGHVYRQAKMGEIDISDASKLANILQILARIIQGSELDDRLTALETQIAKR
ncbi:MAG: hypothetical protein RLZ25_662 [Pseudomonadota bacterium]|jgi:hypothetical protein